MTDVIKSEKQLVAAMAVVQERLNNLPDIKSIEELKESAEFLKGIKATTKAVKDFYEPSRKKTYEAYTAVTSETKK